MRIISGSKNYTRILNNASEYSINEVGERERVLAKIKFQQGRSREAGINGVHSEDLLLIVIDRITRLQEGEFVCPEHDDAIVYLKQAVERLQSRRKVE